MLKASLSPFPIETIQDTTIPANDNFAMSRKKQASFSLLFFILSLSSCMPKLLIYYNLPFFIIFILFLILFFIERSSL